MFRIQKPWLPQKSIVFEDYFEGDNEKVPLCTSLLSSETLKKIFSFVSSRVTRRSLLLSKFQEFNFGSHKIMSQSTTLRPCISL